jgi:D-serine deaminase-like pyridoxal phosphate-dependent protein
LGGACYARNELSADDRPHMTELAERIAREYGTPAAVVDLDRVERNIKRLQAACDAAGVANRPHIKTHKSPLIAAMQRDAGAKGITCQKLGEAEVMAEAGFEEILISYNLIGEEKVGRLAALMGKTEMIVCVDNPVSVAAAAEAAGRAGRPLRVLVECDTGRKRAGVETPGEAVALARMIAARNGLAIAGFLLYPPETAIPQTQRFFDDARAGVRQSGLEPAVVSSGGTPNIANLGKLAGATEHRAGTYVFNDRMMMACGAASLDDCALHVVATVVSRAGPDRGIVDAGSKTLTSDIGGLDGHGLILEHPQARIAKFAEEHGFLDLAACNDRPEVGDVVRIIPNHVCVVVNMMERLIATRGGEIVGEIPVAARGRIS